MSAVTARMLLAVAVGSATPSSNGEEAGWDFSAARRVLEEAVSARVFPGCAVSVGTARGPLWETGVGTLSYEAKEPATPHTLYDLASLTKVVGTTLVVFALVRDGVLALDDPLALYVPEFAVAAEDRRTRLLRASVTLEDLLTHASGLPPWRPLYREAWSYEEVVALAARVPLEAAPRTRVRYSDLGFILLGEAAARAACKPLPCLERQLVFDRLGLRETLRRPPSSLRSRTAPTEVIQGRGALRGLVHDENARAGEGLTGHAGLFSTAADLGRLARVLLRGLDGKSILFPRPLLLRFVRRRGNVPGSSRALGWDTPSGRSSAGDLLSRCSFGHTGFTGTSIWIDPERGLYLVLLTNRVHPTRRGTGIARVRRAFADAVARAYDARTSRRRRL